MNVRDLAIELRPRSSWEAVDLGNALTRQYYRDLLGIGFRGFTIPVLVLAAMCWSVPWLFIVLIWLLKPVADRFYLFYLSQRIFGKSLTVGETLKAWKRFVFQGVLPLLTLRRFTPCRSMTLPIADLEGLTGSSRNHRASIVTRVDGGVALLITLGGLLLEFVTLLSVLILAAILIPDGQSPEWFEFLSWFEEGGLGATLLTLSYGLIYAVIIFFLEPFYLAGGFALYLNSRTKQESWDVELRFRELATRVKQTQAVGQVQPASSTPEAAAGGSPAHRKTATIPVALLAGFLLASSSWQELQAASPDPQEVIAEVLQHEDFKNHTRTTKEWVPNENGWLQRFEDWLDDIFDNQSTGNAGGGVAEAILQLIGILALCALIVVIAVVCYRLFQNRMNQREILEKKRFKRPPPSIVMGMAVTPESLPDDLLGQAKGHWDRNEKRLAMSLLYRGALTHLITHSEVAIEASDTESECVWRVRERASASHGNYFGTLSEQWIKAAYSTRPVSTSDFETLCATWPFIQR